VATDGRSLAIIRLDPGKSGISVEGIYLQLDYGLILDNGEPRRPARFFLFERRERRITATEEIGALLAAIEPR